MNTIAFPNKKQHVHEGKFDRYIYHLLEGDPDALAQLEKERMREEENLGEVSLMYVGRSYTNPVSEVCADLRAAIEYEERYNTHISELVGKVKTLNDWDGYATDCGYEKYLLRIEKTSNDAICWLEENPE